MNRDRFLIRGLAALLQFRGMNFATTPGVVDTGADDGAAGGGDGAAAGAGAGGDGAAAAAAQPKEHADIATLRTNYEDRGKQLDGWTKLGKTADEVAPRFEAGRVLHERYGKAATQLGYSQQEFDDAFKADPDKTIQFIAKKAAEAAAKDGNRQLTQKDIDDRLDKKLKDAISPFEQREQQRLVAEADFKITQNFEKLGGEIYSDAAWKAMDGGEKDFLRMVMDEVMLADEAGLEEVKMKGSTAPIQRAFKKATTFLDSYYTSRVKRETGRPAGKAAAAGKQAAGTGEAKPGHNPENGKPWTVQEMIEEPKRINEKYV